MNYYKNVLITDGIIECGTIEFFVNLNCASILYSNPIITLT